MKILVHVGTPKTGSTTLQVSLIRSQKMLESNDITFFQGYTSLSGDRALISLYRTPPDIILKAHGGKERVIEKSKEEWSNLELLIKNKKPKNLILSSEHFCLEKPKSLFWERIFSLSNDIKIVGYLRDPISLFNSSVNQRIKGGHEITKIFETTKYWNFYSSSASLLKLKTNFKENVLLKSFDKNALYKSDILEDFSKTINIYFEKDIILERVKTLNQSLSGVSLAIIYLLSQTSKKFLNSADDMKEFKKIIQYLKSNDQKFKNSKLILSDNKIYDFVSFYSYETVQKLVNYNIDFRQLNLGHINSLKDPEFYSNRLIEILSEEFSKPNNQLFLRQFFKDIPNIFK